MTHADGEHTSRTPLLDEESTLSRLKGDTEFLKTLYGVFVSDLPKKLAAIDEAAEKQDLDLLQRNAHSLKGAAATIGAIALRDAAFSLEMASKEGRLDQALGFVPAVKQLSGETITRVDESIRR